MYRKFAELLLRFKKLGVQKIVGFKIFYFPKLGQKSNILKIMFLRIPLFFEDQMALSRIVQ